MQIRSPQIASSGYPGQFMMLRVRDELNPLLRRPFSFHRFTPRGEKETFEILFKVVGQGTRIMSRLRPGDTIDILGPLGKGFKMPPPGTKKIWLIAGGMGIAPLFALVEMLEKSNSAFSLELFYGASRAKELVDSSFFIDKGVVVSLCTDDGSCGELGFVTEPAERECHSGHLPDYFYACGPHVMQKAVIEWAGRHNIPGQVSMETLMACGMGVCLGCSLPATFLGHKSDIKRQLYYRVCREGPVFKIGEQF